MTGAPNDEAPDESPAGEPIPKRLPGMGAGYARYAGVGVHFAVTILVFAYGGYRLDLWLDTSPWFLLIGVFVGFFGGMLSLVNRVKKVTADQAARDHLDQDQDG